MTAKDVMRRNVVTISAGASVTTAVRLMHDSGYPGLPVTGAASKVVGMLDRMTLLRLMVPQYAEEIGDLAFLPEDFQAFESRLEEIGCRMVSDVMRPCDICATEDTPLMEVATLMVLKRVEQVPVLREGELAGVIGLEEVVDQIARCQGRRGEEA